MEPKPASLTRWIDEYHNGVRYGLEGKVLFNEKSCFQQITFIESKRYGTALLLDGCWMTAELQEKSYHECLVQPALCSAKNINNVLIIGGGDGGTARECLRHAEVKRLDLVEIDRRVVELSQKYLPTLGGNAWTDPRLHININDGVEWVKNKKGASYDVIIIDSSDPQGPAKGLFNKLFFENCKRILRSGGVFATQSESPEAFRKIHIETIKTIREVFDFADPLYGSVPLYPSGWWSWTFAAMGKQFYKEPIQQRAQTIASQCDIWSIEWQTGAFKSMPASIHRELSQ